MRDFNWRWLVVPVVPPAGILYVRALCVLAQLPWPTDGAMTLTVLFGLCGSIIASAWASGAFE